MKVTAEVPTLPQLSENDLDKELRLVRRSLQCPNCGGLIGDLSGQLEIICKFCRHSFGVTAIKEESRNQISYKKLRQLSRLQVENVTMSSRMDIQYDPKRFVARSDATNLFERFIAEKSTRKKLFLLLGEAGLGKTWLVANWANNLLRNGYPTFFVRLLDGIGSFFRTTFDCSRTEALRDIKNIPEEIGGGNPIVWIMDGYDEIHDRDERSLLLAEFLKNLEKNDNQLAVITSRAFDWWHCNTRKDQSDLLKRLIWVPSRSDGSPESFRLTTYTPAEVTTALKTYKLPGLAKWTPVLQSLAPYPLWVRLIAEWYADQDALPSISDYTLYDAYRTRMQLDRSHLVALASLAYQLLRHGDFTQDLPLAGPDQVPENLLGELNSRGIVTYNDDVYNPTIRISMPAFGWYGIAYYAHNKSREGAESQLSEVLALLEKLPISDQTIIIDLLSSMGVQIPNKPVVKIALNNYGIYHDTRLFAPECDAMLKVEGLLGRPVPKMAQVERRSFGFVEKGEHVIALSLYQQGLSSLPEAIGQFISLQYLYLLKNTLPFLPEAIGQLSSLKELHLNWNKLSSLPVIIGNLSSLKKLNLENNQLSVLTESVKRALKKLKKSGCTIEGIEI